ncbi:guanitoxin biosynthesis L-enduracididine beta-hydroxylase GntD [Nonomuraea sp. NPDC004186]
MTALEVCPEYILSDSDVAAISAIAEELRDAGENPADPEFYDRCWPVIERIPSGVRRFLEEFRRGEPAAACLIHGFPIDDDATGPTPPHWEAAFEATSTREQEIFLALCGMILGDPFTWSTLQSGRLIQNILPIAGDEMRQNGHGSQTLLEFHTEDGFHPDRCDYLLLLGIRNHQRVPTLAASVRDIALSDEDRAVLGQERFYIFPDDEHVRQLETRDPQHPGLAAMRGMRDSPEPVAVLFGDQADPYLRIDRPFMRCTPGDTEAERALDALDAALQRAEQDIVVGPGTLLVVDNHLAVHGRKPFEVRYDGTDRWLKKLTVSRNLRRSRAISATKNRRVLF